MFNFLKKKRSLPVTAITSIVNQFKSENKLDLLANDLFKSSFSFIEDSEKYQVEEYCNDDTILEVAALDQLLLGFHLYSNHDRQQEKKESIVQTHFYNIVNSSYPNFQYDEFLEDRYNIYSNIKRDDNFFLNLYATLCDLIIETEMLKENRIHGNNTIIFNMNAVKTFKYKMYFQKASLIHIKEAASLFKAINSCEIL